MGCGKNLMKLNILVVEYEINTKRVKYKFTPLVVIIVIVVVVIEIYVVSGFVSSDIIWLSII